MGRSMQWLFHRAVENDDSGPPFWEGAAPHQNLKRVLSTRRWIKCLHPFPHVRAENVFEPDWYSNLEAHFGKLLSAGLSEVPASNRFSRSITGFDAYLLDLVPESAGPLRMFMSHEWHEMISRTIGVHTSGDVLCSLHHHPARSRNGKVHNDLNPGWFIDYPEHSGLVRVAQLDLCNYKTGRTSDQLLAARENVRAVAVLFYLNNHDWKLGDGGETGLYDSLTASVECPVISVPPVNNSLLAFECTPFSFHSFIRNRKHPRNSFIMWLHCPIGDAINRWGRRSIAYWPGSSNGTVS